MITFSKFTIIEIAKWKEINEQDIAKAYTCKMMGELDLAKQFMSKSTDKNQLNSQMVLIGKQKVSNWDNVNRYL